MTRQTDFEYRDFQRWRRPAEVGFWVVLSILNTVFNSMVARIDHARTAAWEPWVWEWSSSILILALIPAVLAVERRWPFRFDTWRRSLPWHLLATVPFSLIHVAGMTVLRKLAYAVVGEHYDAGAWLPNFGYEYLKDIRTYFIIIALICLSRLWLMRWQGEVRLLVAPEDGPPVEPVERPERFLVRKLGREFLINASEIEWLQAVGQLRESARARARLSAARHHGRDRGTAGPGALRAGASQLFHQSRLPRRDRTAGKRRRTPADARRREGPLQPALPRRVARAFRPAGLKRCGCMAAADRSKLAACSRQVCRR